MVQLLRLLLLSSFMFVAALAQLSRGDYNIANDDVPNSSVAVSRFGKPVILSTVHATSWFTNFTGNSKNNLYTIQDDGDGSYIYKVGKTIFNGNHHYQWSIIPAGSNLYKVHDPNDKQKIWTVQKPEDPEPKITLAKDIGSSTQLWSFSGPF